MSDLQLLIDAARDAGALAVSMRKDGLRIRGKPGGSPVTDADMAVDARLRERLTHARPDYGWLSEETVDDLERLDRTTLFVVDPIDGTVAFIKHLPWWTVALSVVENGAPVAAVLYAPELGELYEAEAGAGARLNGEPIRPSGRDSLDGASVLVGQSLLQQPGWPTPWPPLRAEKRNSIAYRMALVGSGAFDATFAVTPKHDWDMAAGSLIASEAGAIVTDHRGDPFRFNRPEPRQPGLICATPGLHPTILDRCRAFQAT